MFSFFPRATFTVLAVVFFLASNSSADTFTDRMTFESANPNLTTIDFEGIAPPGDTIQPAPQPWAPAVVFSDPFGTDSIAISDSAFFFDTPTDALFVNLFDEPLTATFAETLNGAGGVNAVGFDLAIGFGGLGATIDVFGTGGDLIASESLDTAIETEFTTFVGFSGLGEIGSLVVTPEAGGFVLIDNFSFGETVPEPASTTLLAFAAGMALVRRRR